MRLALVLTVCAAVPLSAQDAKQRLTDRHLAQVTAPQEPAKPCGETPCEPERPVVLTDIIRPVEQPVDPPVLSVTPLLPSTPMPRPNLDPRLPCYWEGCVVWPPTRSPNERIPGD